MYIFEISTVRSLGQKKKKKKLQKESKDKQTDGGNHELIIRPDDGVCNRCVFNSTKTRVPSAHS